jgi:hypothetical protein
MAAAARLLTQLEQFQDTHFNHVGLRLVVDNDMGPETKWAMAAATLSTPRRAAITEAQKYRGLIEYPPRSNTDPKGIIQGWLERAGAEPGMAWCASALSAWLSAGLATPVKIPGALNLGHHFPLTTTPWAGDIYWFATDDQGHGHCGLVIGVGPKEVMGIEGNSNNAWACVRRPRERLSFSRTFSETLGTCPGVIAAVPMAGGGTR